MPLYAYRCAVCDADFELLQSLHADASATRCPDCGGQVARLMSGFAPAVAAGSSASAPAAGGCGMPGGGCGSGMCGM